MFIIELVSSFSCSNIIEDFVWRKEWNLFFSLFSDIISDLTDYQDQEELNPSDDEENLEDTDLAGF